MQAEEDKISLESEKLAQDDDDQNPTNNSISISNHGESRKK